MPGDTGISAEGRVVKTIGKGRFWLELDNGHRLVAFAVRRTRTNVAEVQPGDRLRVRVSSAELSRGRIE